MPDNRIAGWEDFKNYHTELWHVANDLMTRLDDMIRPDPRIVLPEKTPIGSGPERKNGSHRGVFGGIGK